MRDRARVAIVDDHAMGRRGLEAMLSTADWLRVVAEGSDGRDAIAIRFSEDPPDLLVVNGLMPGMGGPEAIAIIRDRERAEGLPGLPIVIDSLSDDQLKKGLAAGADAAFSLESSTSEVLAAVARALSHRDP